MYLPGGETALYLCPRQLKARLGCERWGGGVCVRVCVGVWWGAAVTVEPCVYGRAGGGGKGGRGEKRWREDYIAAGACNVTTALKKPWHFSHTNHYAWGAALSHLQLIQITYSHSLGVCLNTSKWETRMSLRSGGHLQYNSSQIQSLAWFFQRKALKSN